jgi:1-aminocyclopropane-1-carboxylate synthase
LAYTRFCEEKDLHLVSDEIYALSTYSHPGTSLSIDRAVLISDFKDAEGFTSLLSLDVERELGMVYDRARLHGEHQSQQT